MITAQSRTNAAHKAVATARYRKIEKVNHLPYILLLAEQIQDAERHYDYDHTRESFIAKNIAPTTYQSFTRFGDRKASTAGLILFWISIAGMPLDEQAMFMSGDYGQDIHPDELARFMMDHDRGIGMFPQLAKIKELKKIFFELTYFHYDPSWIKKHLIVEEFVEDLPF